MTRIQLDPACRECFVAMTTRVAAMHELPAGETAALLADLRALLDTAPGDWPPPRVARETARRLRRAVGADDPFAAIKRVANERAGALADELRARVAAAPDRLAAAVRVALAGNVIDFAYQGDQDLSAAVARMAAAPLGIDDLETLRANLARARRVLVIGDNAGEVWCDRVLIENLPPGVATTYAVRGGPAINDATMEDARAAGLDEVAEVIASGCDAPGTLLDLIDEPMRAALREADVVIAKGQGNFESLVGRCARPVHFLFLVKCAHVERIIGQPVGTGISWWWQPA